MRFFYEDGTQQRNGPYTVAELRQLHLNGVIRPETLVLREGESSGRTFREVWAELQQVPPPPPGNDWALSKGLESFGQFTQHARADLRAMLPHLLVPWEEVRSFRWLGNARLTMVATIGLFPLFIIAFFSDARDIRSAYWAIAFYFSAVWAVFFYNLFPAPNITLRDSLICFFGTGIVSISLLLLAYRVPPLSLVVKWAGSNDFVVRWLGFTFGVGVPEEICKVLVLYFFWKQAQPLPPQTMLFYGLMCGLGFGIYEGVDYQMGRNLVFSSGVGEYYLLNVLRLTTLPFLHAVWSGIAAYFIGFARIHAARRRGLLIVAIGLPAVLHGTYDAVRSSFVSLLLAFFSVIALMLYQAKSVDFEKALTERQASE